MRTTSGTLLPAITGLTLLTFTACGGPDVTDPPELSEIDELMWETMEGQDSVTITMGSPDDETDDNVQVYGDMAGDTLAMGQPDRDMLRIFGQDEGYISGDLFLTLPGKTPEVDAAELEGLSEEFDDTWIDFDSELGVETEQYRIPTLLAEIEDGWSDAEGESPMARGEISDDGTHEVHDDIDVWVYPATDGEKALVVEADHHAPKLLSITDGENATMFSDWGTTEPPQRPEKSEVISEEEFEQRVEQALTVG